MSNTAVPSKAEAEQHMNELEQRGITAELQCARCNDPTEARVLPGESVDVTICRSCGTDHLRTTDLI